MTPRWWSAGDGWITPLAVLDSGISCLLQGTVVGKRELSGYAVLR